MKIWTCLLLPLAIFAGCSKKGDSQPTADNAASAAESPDTACDVVYVDKSTGFYLPTPLGEDRGLLVRELFRQALLIAAREELGLVTRDAWLGDTIPSEGAIRPFDLVAVPGSPPRLQVLRGFPSAVKPIDAADLPVVAIPDHCLKPLWVEVEKLSRTRLLEILRKALGPRQARPWTLDPALAGSIEESLGEMSFVRQFSAARQIHDVMASKGQSPALLGALVRAYANLGVLTEFHWHPAHKVFKARAILYAQRWAARQPDSLPAQWHRAYAVALAGAHAEALEELESAEKVWQAMAEKQRPPRPGWLALLDAYLHYDIDKLAAELDHPQHGKLAALLHYHAVELAGHKRWALQTAATTLHRIPGCYRVHDGVCEFGGVSVSHLATVAPFRVLARTLYDQVSQIPGLPESVRAQAKRPATAQPATDRDEEDVSPEFQARARLMAALREASSPGATSAVQAKAGPGSESGKASSNAPGEKPSARLADIGEPSWAALGHLIQEVSFVHVWRRADFERHQLSVPSDDFLALAAPLVKDHPLRPFLDTLAWDVVKQRDAMARAARLAPDGLELQAEPLLSSFVQFHVSSGNPILKAMVQRNDAVTRDYVVMGRLMALQNNPTQLRGIAESLLSISPQSPLARGYLVSVGAASKDQIAHWEKPAVKYPFLAYALAGHYAKAKQWDDAAGWCQVAIKIAEDTDLYQFLADVYQKKGDERRWLETLEAALRLPDYALDHAQIQSKIAYHFMAKKQWKRALPYATGAAESYSGWGLLCAAACYEALQEWDKAEQYARATAERYRMSSYEWYRFCRRTGHGDLQAARRLARAYAEDHSAQDDRNARYYVASFFVLEAERDKAMALFREQFASEADPVLGLWIAVLADELKDAKTRDAALARIRTDGSSAVVGSAGRPRKELIQLADWIERDLAQGGKGQIDLQAVEELRAAAQQAGDLSFFDVFLARYLQSHGNRDEAIHYWKERLASTDVLNDSRTFAGAALCDLGLMPETYKALLEEAPQAEAKKQDKKESTENGKSGHPKPAGAAAKSRA